MNKRAVISFGNHRGNYYKSLDRLEESLKGKTDADVIMYRNEDSIGAPDHMDNMYAFKIFCFAHTLAKKYRKILWVDSSVYAIKEISPVFEIIERDGYIMQEAGCWVGEWANDNSLKATGLTRDAAMSIPCYGNAGLLGLDFDNEKSIDFFNNWMLAMCSGLFIGKWNNNQQTESQDPRCKGHRHDLVIGSILAHRFGMKYQKGDEILQYAAPEDKPHNDTIVFFAQGM